MNVERPVYLDASALVKLVVAEPESPALNRYLASRLTRASSALARVEVVRSVRGRGMMSLQRSRVVLDPLDFVWIDGPILESAALLEPLSIRSLDAIHLASALALGPDLESLVTYDIRMREAALLLGIPVSSPS